MIGSNCLKNKTNSPPSKTFDNSNIMKTTISASDVFKNAIKNEEKENYTTITSKTPTH